MPRSPFSLKSANLLMWSSPLLLLVLVFTLTASSPPHVPAALSPPPSSTSPVTTLAPTPVTTTSTKTTTTTTTPSTPAIVAAKTTKTTWPTVGHYSNVTTTTARPSAANSNASAMSGDLSGTLTPGFDSVDVPLRGPGDWTLSASASSAQSLNCGAATSPVANQVVVGPSQSCQLEITAPAGTSLTWQLTPNT